MRTAVLDHLIVSEHSYFSFKDSGLMDQFFLSRKYLPSFELEKRFQQKAEMARKEVEKHRATIEKQGIQIGEEKGMEKGSKEEKRSIAKSMLKKGLDVSLIMEVTGLPKITINKLYKEIG
jgi:predicted transposase/invertase (TIGR01784 family)